MTQKHPDFQMEVERLEVTKNFIENFVEVIKLNEKQHVQDIRQAFIDLDYLDSSQSYITILTSTKLLEYGRENFRKLEAAEDKPYFARIDFRSQDSSKFQKYYIGKISLADDAELKDIMDVDITTNDAFLQASLGANVDNRLKDIAATIQAEQNRVIRAEIDRPLVVQGAAGSGKTTIALHRVAYLIYTYEEDFIPENFFIFAPNRLFINYISEVLPELGVERVKQTTFVDFLSDIVGLSLSLTDPSRKLVDIIDSGGIKQNNIGLIRWAAGFKASMTFKDIIDRYLADVEKNFVPDVDFVLEDVIVLSSEEIRRIFSEEYRFLPLYKRVEMVKKILTAKLKPAKEQLTKAIEDSYGRPLDSLRSKEVEEEEEEEKRRQIIELIDKRDEKLKAVQSKARSAVKNYIKVFPKKDLLFYFRVLMTQEKLLDRYAKGRIEPEKIRFFCRQSADLIKNKDMEFEDLAPLAYLKYRLFGFDEQFEVKHVVIDEAQDLSSFQIYVLKEILNTDQFTIFGDLAQGIHAYRGTNNWEQLIEDVFPTSECNFKTLEQSYRTTIEIMDLANNILKNLNDPGVIYAKPVIRHGEKPVVLNLNDEPGIVEAAAEQIRTYKNKDYNSIAIICKTAEECKYFKEKLESAVDLKIDLVLGDEDAYSGGLMILPAYVAVTRARQELAVIYKENTIQVLD